MAGEGNPTDPAQARLQVSRHVKVVGLLLVQRGHVPTHMRLSDNTSSHNTLEFGGNAGVPDGLRAAETAFVYLCLSKKATVDTTIPPYSILPKFLALEAKYERNKKTSY